MPRYRLQVAYDGTHYAGWQIQPNGVTIQEKLEAALRAITGTPIRVHGSGRTDAGVHARAQVAHFDTDWERAERQLISGVNAKLPPDIRVRDLEAVAPDFHAQYHAISKEYRYRVWNGPVVPPFLRLYRTPCISTLDLGAMRRAAELLIGEHDFVAFSANPKEEREGTVRILYALDVDPDGEDLTIQVQGNGFLYKMVRSLSGWLLDVGQGKSDPEQTADILASRKRSKDVVTAPAKGLFLWDVHYPST